MKRRGPTSAFQRPDWEPAPEVLFRRRPIGKPPDSTHSPGQFRLSSATGPVRTYCKSERFDFATADLPALSLDLGRMSLVSVTGTESETYSLDLYAEIATDDHAQGTSLLQGVVLQRDGERLLLKAPPNPEEVSAQTYLDVLIPIDRPVLITGTYAAVDVVGTSGPVNVSTSHGRVRLFDLTGHVDASAMEGGSIVFAANAVHANLTADLGIDIRIKEQQYSGSLEAKANGAIRVGLPRGFRSGLEASVASIAQFACRVELGAKFLSRNDRDRVILNYGPEQPPRIRLISLHGPVILDRSA